MRPRSVVPTRPSALGAPGKAETSNTRKSHILHGSAHGGTVNAWGNLTRQQGTSAQPFGFTGYQRDEESDLYYAQQRYYDAFIGRFTREDPFQGEINAPPSLHRYLYANANPTAFVDPTGEYARAGHYYTVYYVALRSGFSDADAQQLAFYAQLPDEADVLDAISVQSDALLHDSARNILQFLVDKFAPSSFRFTVDKSAEAQERDKVQRVLHALTGRLSLKETQATAMAIRSLGRDFRALGFLAHRFGDTFAHRKLGANPPIQYRTGPGHGSDFSEPDIIQLRPELYLHYVFSLARLFAEKNGLGEVAANHLAAAVRDELTKVAYIPLFDGEFRSPRHWQEPSPFPQIKTQEQLETQSIRILLSMLRDIGVSINYRPEFDDRPFEKLKSLIPFKEVRSLSDALDYFNNNTGSGEDMENVTKAFSEVVDVLNRASIKAGLDHVIVVEGDNNASSRSLHR